MIRFKLKNMIEEHEFKTGKRLLIQDLADATKINRMTLSKIINQRGYNTSLDKLDKLCEFFKCDITDLIERITFEEFEKITKDD